MSDSPKIDKFARHRARRLLIQALYQWQMAQTDIKELTVDFVTSDKAKKADVAYFQALIKAIIQDSASLDAHMQPFLDRKMEQLGPIEIAILRLGIYELAYRLEIPYRVVINEALELCKTFGAEESYKYINGILDKVAKVLRQTETQHDQQ